MKLLPIETIVMEEDAHVKMYKKEYHKAEYLEIRCPKCEGRIDELGFCNCGAGSS